MKATFILPFNNGSIQFPGLAEDEPRPSTVTISYAPPPSGAPYVLVDLDTTQANINILTARAECLLLATYDEENIRVAVDVPANERNAMRLKVQAMGFTGKQFGLINGAIQSGNMRPAMNAFFRNIESEFITDAEVDGGGLA